jgi:glucose/arabinose dehydrogenase
MMRSRLNAARLNVARRTLAFPRPRAARFLALESVFMTLVVLAGMLFAPAPQAFADQFVDPDFTTEAIAGFDPYSLVGMAFAPDGRIFVWQKSGVVRIVKNGQVLPTPFLDISAQVNSVGDRGFWGFALDPDFASNGYVYTTYVYESGGDPQSQDPRTSRLTRITADPTNPDVALPGSEVVLLGSVSGAGCSAQPAGADCIPAESVAHTIGDIVFAADGTMFVGNGDGAHAIVDPGTLRAQDLDSYSGKILHINKDGSAVADNPFYDGSNSVRSKVWLYGVRNPFRFSLQPGTGELWLGDVGWNAWEEVDHGVKGGNLGWPCYEGNDVVSAYSAMAPCTTLAPSSVTFPYHTYDHSVGSTAIGGPFYSGSVYPNQYHGNLFFADYVGGFIKRVVFDASNNPVGVETFATNVDTPVGLVLGPDGLIYYLSFASGQIRRIVWHGLTVTATATPRYGHSPLAVSFSSAGSQDPGGGALSYLWDFGDGATSTGANPTHTYVSGSAHTFVAMLTVTNGDGLANSTTVDVTVGSVPPVPTITAPGGAPTIRPGQTVNYAGQAVDDEDGALPPGSLSWTVLLHHNTHVHTFAGGTGASGSFVVEDHGSVGAFWYELILTATDSSGLKASRSLTLPVGNDPAPPTAPASLTATGATSAIGLTWPASSDNFAVAGYRVERCQGAGCSSFAPVASTSKPGYTDSGLAAATTYRYRVLAVDPSNNVSSYSPIATGTTSAAPGPDGSAPSTPTGLAGVAIRANEIDLTWGAATDNVGVTGYRVQRCTGASCATFALLASPGTAEYTDLELPASTTYGYRVAALDAAGNVGGFSSVLSVTTGAVALPAGAFVALPPSRILDTRKGNGAVQQPIADHGSIDLQVAGRGGVPASGVAAVVLNMTVTQPTWAGYVVAYPTGGAAPVASNLNFQPGQTIPNLVTVALGADGKVTLLNGSFGTVQLIADVAGYYLGGTATQPGTFVPLAPSRILDTRKGNGAVQQAVPDHGSIDLQVAGRGGVPATGVAAVVLNVTVTAPSSDGSVVAYPAGSAVPVASNLNFAANQTIPNLVTVKLGVDGKVTLTNNSFGTVQLIADVAGYYLGGTATEPGTFVALPPSRVLDTRVGTGAPADPVSPGGVISLQVAGQAGVPATGAGAVVMNVTATQPTWDGYIVVFPTGDALPVASNLNFVANQTIANLVTIKLGLSGQVTLRNGSAGTVQLIADVAGYFIG